MAASPRMAFFTTVGTLAYIGLGVLGVGGLPAYLAHPPLIAVAVVLFALSAIAPFTSGNLRVCK
jgi:hypothetical protein